MNGMTTRKPYISLPSQGRVSHQCRHYFMGDLSTYRGEEMVQCSPPHPPGEIHASSSIRPRCVSLNPPPQEAIAYRAEHHPWKLANNAFPVSNNQRHRRKSPIKNTSASPAVLKLIYSAAGAYAHSARSKRLSFTGRLGAMIEPI